MNISKIIPFNIRIKSLYWVRKEKEIDSDLTILFGKIDDDFYSEARVLLEELRKKLIQSLKDDNQLDRAEYIEKNTRVMEVTFNI